MGALDRSFTFAVSHTLFSSLQASAAPQADPASNTRIKLQYRYLRAQQTLSAGFRHFLGTAFQPLGCRLRCRFDCGVQGVARILLRSCFASQSHRLFIPPCRLTAQAPARTAGSTKAPGVEKVDLSEPNIWRIMGLSAHVLILETGCHCRSLLQLHFLHSLTRSDPLDYRICCLGRLLE